MANTPFYIGNDEPEDHRQEILYLKDELGTNNLEGLKIHNPLSKEYSDILRVVKSNPFFGVPEPIQKPLSQGSDQCQTIAIFNGIRAIVQEDPFFGTNDHVAFATDLRKRVGDNLCGYSATIGDKLKEEFQGLVKRLPITSNSVLQRTEILFGSPRRFAIVSDREKAHNFALLPLKRSDETSAAIILDSRTNIDNPIRHLNINELIEIYDKTLENYLHILFFEVNMSQKD